MAPVVLLIVLVVVAFLLYKAVEDARRQKAGGTGSTAGGSPSPRPQARAKPALPKARPRPRRKPLVDLDEPGLTEHLRKLRMAIEEDQISMDEGVESVVRFTGGALGADAARKLLRDAG